MIKPELELELELELSFSTGLVGVVVLLDAGLATGVEAVSSGAVGEVVVAVLSFLLASADSED